MSDIQTYISNRVDEQIKWYAAQTSSNRVRYHLFQFIVIIASSIVPLVNVIDFLPISTRIISAALGSLVTIISSFIQLNKYDENWLSYRITCEALKKEKYMFLYDSGDYSNKGEKEKDKLFVHKIETILMSKSETKTKKNDENTGEKGTV